MNQLIEKLNSEFPVTEKTGFQMIDVNVKQYAFALPQVISSLQKTYSKICIISTSRKGSLLLNELNKKGIKTEILILSGIKEKETTKIISFEPQWKLDSIKKAISYSIKNFSPEIFVFDSLTNLTLFLTKDEINDFAEKFTQILSERKIKTIFLNIKEETSEEIAVRVEAVMDNRMTLEKFLGRKTIAIKTKTIKQKETQQQIKAVSKTIIVKQQLDVKSLKKSLSSLIKDEARKIAEETRKNLKINEPAKQPEKELLKEKFAKKTEKKPEEKKDVYSLEKEKEKQNLLKKLDLLEKSFELGVISNKAFEEGKQQIKQKLKGK